MASIKLMGFKILDIPESSKVPVQGTFAKTEDAANGPEGGVLKIVDEPFFNPVGTVDDGTDIWVLSGGLIKLVDSNHQNSVSSPGVARIEKASGAVIDCGYYGAGPRLNGEFPQNFLVDMCWTGKRLFAITADLLLAQVGIAEVVRSPIKFNSKWEQSDAINLNQIEYYEKVDSIYDKKLFVAGDGYFYIFDPETFASPVYANLTLADPAIGVFRFAIDTDGLEKVYGVDPNSEQVFWVDVKPVDLFVGAVLGGQAPFADCDRIAWAPTFGALVTTTTRFLHMVDDTLTSTFNIDLSATFDAIYGLKCVGTKAYLWGVKDNAWIISRVAVGDGFTLDHTTTFNVPTDGSDDQFASSISQGFVTTKAAGDADMLWVANPLYSKALLSPTGEVSSVDLTDSLNPATLVTSPRFSRWV